MLNTLLVQHYPCWKTKNKLWLCRAVETHPSSTSSFVDSANPSIEYTKTITCVHTISHCVNCYTHTVLPWWSVHFEPIVPPVCSTKMRDFGTATASLRPSCCSHCSTWLMVTLSLLRVPRSLVPWFQLGSSRCRSLMEVWRGQSSHVTELSDTSPTHPKIECSNGNNEREMGVGWINEGTCARGVSLYSSAQSQFILGFSTGIMLHKQGIQHVNKV